MVTNKSAFAFSSCSTTTQSRAIACAANRLSSTGLANTGGSGTREQQPTSLMQLFTVTSG
jgi:hypothetical protein